MFAPVRYIIIVVFVFISTTVTVPAQANSITLAWNPNDPAEQVRQYRLYYKIGYSGPPFNGTGLDQGDSPIIIRVNDLADENNPTVVLSGLSPFATYRFVMTAFNGRESGYSNEASLAARASAAGIYDLLLSR